MNEIKEVIQGKIDIMKLLQKSYDINYEYFDETLEKLEQQLQQAKSIEDIEREAFEAGREIKEYDFYKEGIKFNIFNDMPYKYETFEDYLKSKEDGNKSN